MFWHRQALTKWRLSVVAPKQITTLLVYEKHTHRAMHHCLSPLAAMLW
jgi:hypothetical protein